MTRQEISEIKKTFKINNCSVTRICGCYVDFNKNIKDRWEKPFLSMDEEDLFKYLEIFRKCFSGGLEKNLFNIPISTKEVRDSLLELRDSQLKDNDKLDEFYENIIDTYDYVGNYLILTIHDVYDIPGKTRDGIEMEDASDEVYEYILTCICPVKLQKPCLGYDREKKEFTHIERDWLLSPPELAIVYPAFNDRSEDRDAALLYARNLQIPDKEFIERFLGYSINMNHNEERATFESILEETLGAADLKEVRAVHETLLELAVEHNNDPEPYKLDKEEIENILHASGISEEKMKRFDTAYHGNVNKDLTLDNIVNRKSFKVDTKTASIRMDPEYANEISIQEINGRACLVMNIIGDVRVNGITVCGEPGSSTGGADERS